MVLEKYKQKRNFKKTPEPTGGKKKGKALSFCVQKHDATRLHYDFRLEYRGVLLSWAIPKGPSMDPKDKRLAVHTEDHPLDYLTFHGTIPEGNYGAGTVELWDIGTYAPVYPFEEGLKKGHLTFTLQGKKLRGTFHLVRIRQEDQWLLMKGHDSYVAKPEWFSPMLATFIKQPFSDEEWIFEVKFDGYRALAFTEGDQVQIYSRNHNSFNLFYPTIVEALKKLKVDAIFDGEIVSLNDEGISKFELLKNYQSAPEGHLCYYIFDLLYCEGKDLRQMPLIQRKELLEQLLKKKRSDILRYADHIEAKGEQFFKEVEKRGMEGIMAKKKDSPYLSKRTKEWLKIKCGLRQEAVVAGFTEPKGSRSHFGSLALGVYEGKGKKKKLRYIGQVGTGFNQKMLQEIEHTLHPLIQSKCPFATAPKGLKATWVKPKVLCEISFAEWTKDGIMRQPVFHGIREDKPAKEVVEEVPETEQFTHLDKLYWKKEKIAKRDMIAYYRSVADHMLPYLKDHPVMLKRYPNGIEGEHFYQKDIKYKPPYIKTVEVEHEEKRVRYLLIQDEASLLYAANMGSIEIHPWIMDYKHMDKPAYLVIDLDPVEISFEVLIKMAQQIHRLLESLDIPSYCKTSGGRGLHIYIPLQSKYTFEQTETFARLLATIVYRNYPDTISLERSPAKRKKRVYFDYLQNLHGGRTMVAPYSLRARPHAPVSTPLFWKEVVPGLDPLSFTLKTVPARLKKLKKDPFEGVDGPGIDLKKVLAALDKFL